ncbi:metallopeptidase MepB [Rhizoctonia solani AG-1 IA]|uniref:Metallopeptidase MepB n=1 Tax=Thanatephorus cucumeris (strain AG1-IA) TaxID=983506 RepID=L8WIE0_THACA|nr:metallopeptidase MepB [Rhizoctonia solani AG-1 IA]
MLSRSWTAALRQRRTGRQTIITLTVLGGGIYLAPKSTRLASTFFRQRQMAPLRWDHSPEDVMSFTKEAIENSRNMQDTVASLSESECSFGSVFLPLALAEAHLDATTEPLSFYQNVSPNEKLRDAATEAEKLVREFGIESSMRVDVYTALLNARKKGEKLTKEEQRLVDKMILDGKRAGLALPEDKRAELMKLKKELSVVCTDFGRNFNEEKAKLNGVPEDVINGYTPVEGTDKLAVTFKTPDIFPLFKYAQNPTTRERAHVAYENRLEINIPLLSRAIELRRQCAAILGYKNWADYVEEEKMIKTSKDVIDFLADLEEKLRPVGTKDRDTLLKLKEKEHAKLGLPYDEYFPVDVVVPTILEIYQDLLGVEFQEIKGNLWHPESKYSHAAVWPLQPGFDSLNGRNYPTAAMVANLAKPTPGRPALMRHDDVTRFGRFHGTSVARDFVEAPSQMLENWCWEPEVLKKMSSHYEKKEPLSDELIKKLIDSRYVNVGLFYLRQIFFGKFDIKVHTQDTQGAKADHDYSTLWGKLREETSLVKSGSSATHGQATFAHITGGYDAGYYSYAYSLVFAADMYKTVFKGAPLDPARGASRDEIDSLKDFLGREPNSEAFLENLLGKSLK